MGGVVNKKRAMGVLNGFYEMILMISEGHMRKGVVKLEQRQAVKDSRNLLRG